MTRPRPAIFVLAASALALGLGTVGLASAGSGMHVESVGKRPSVAQSLPGQTPSGRPAPPSATPDNSSATPPSNSPYRSLARVDATRLPRPDRSPRPVSLQIPALDLRVPIDVVGLDGLGQVDVPSDVRRVGWYRYSSKPGTALGSAVIVGHRDGVDQGAGAFIDLARLRPGDVIAVKRADGSEQSYEVTARESFDKSEVPLRELFSRTGPARLTLITCGGPFDPSALSYTDNIVITALPVAIGSDSGQTR